MGLWHWWRERKRLDATARSVAMNNDLQLMACHVPEMSGLGKAEAMTYVIEQVEAWKAVCSPAQRTEFTRRAEEAIAADHRDGIVSPPWGVLWILRNYQTELGLDVPPVSSARR